MSGCLHASGAGRLVADGMPSFRDISGRFPALVLDAASSQVQVGVLSPGAGTSWQASTDEAGVAVFQCIEALGARPLDMQAFVFCEGPGSVLGIRTVAMAIRTWRVLRPTPVFAYSSLALVAHAVGRNDIGIIADARRDSWHHFQLGQGLRRVASAELHRPLAMPENFRHWSPLPAEVTRVPYSVSELVARAWDADVLHETTAPDAFLHEEPSYVTWTPQIHQPRAAT